MDQSTEDSGRSRDLDRYVIQAAEEHLTDALMCAQRAATVARRLLPDDLAEAVRDHLQVVKVELLAAINVVVGSEDEGAGS